MTSDGGVTWTDIPGAAATTYTPPAGSAGKQLRVLVTGTNGDGNSQAADSLAGKTGSQAAKPKRKQPKPKQAKQNLGKPKAKRAPQRPQWHLVPRWPPPAPHLASTSSGS